MPRAYVQPKAIIGSLQYMNPNEETIMATKTLTSLDSPLQKLDPVNNSYHIILPDPIDCNGSVFYIMNSSSGSGILQVYDHTDTHLIVNVDVGLEAKLTCIGTDWESFSSGSGGGSTETGATILAKLLPVDGSSSGLDADLLDGRESSYFSTNTDLINHVGDLAIHRTINDSGSSTTDLWSASKITNAIAAGGGGGSETGASILSKLAPVDGSGSGLDADLLDGNNTSYFATASGLSSHIGTSSVHRTINDSGSSTTDLWSANKIASEISSGGSSETGASILSKLAPVDGSGSGLDADLLDGHSSSYFASSSHAHSNYISSTSADTADGKITFDDGIVTDSIDGTSITFFVTNGPSGSMNFDPYRLQMNTDLAGTAGKSCGGGNQYSESRWGDVRTDELRLYRSGTDDYLTIDTRRDGTDTFNYVRMNGDFAVAETLWPCSDGAQDIGSGSWRWNDIYATNSTIQTSDEREKTNILPLGNNELNLLMAIDPISFKWDDVDKDAVFENRIVQKIVIVSEEVKKVTLVNGKYIQTTTIEDVEKSVYETVPVYDENDNIVGEKETPVMEEKLIEVTPSSNLTFVRTHYGISSQQLKQAIIDNNLDPDLIAAYIHNSEEDTYGVRYTELIPLLINAVQYLKNEIDILKSA